MIETLRVREKKGERVKKQGCRDVCFGVVVVVVVESRLKYGGECACDFGVDGGGVRGVVVG